MRFRTTLILLAVLAGLLALVAVFDKKGEEKKAADEKENTLVSVAAADILKASIVKNGQTLAFERDEAGPWRLTAPLQAAADEYEVNSLVGTLASLRIERVVEKDARDLAAYEIPKTEVSLWVKGQETPVRLLVGMENPLDKSLFAKRADDPRVVLLSSSLKTTLEKPVFDFRQKDVFKFTAADVTAIRVKARNVAWQASREGPGWFLKTPVAALAVKGTIDALLDSLSGIRAKAFVAEEKTPASLKTFGLDSAEYEVALSLPATEQEIIFYLHREDDNSYATTSRSAKIVNFEGTLLADLDRKVDELREKKVADFYSWNAARIALKRDGVEIAAIKEGPAGAEKWVLDDPAKEEANRNLVEDFLRKIEGLQATGFVDDPGPLAAYGLDPGAEIRIRVKDPQDPEKEIVIFVGREDAENKEVVVKTPGLGYLLRVDSAFVRDWPKEKKDWKAAAPAVEEGKTDKK
ncbi:MAG: DUF4340 domain-containing protein [Candidatus Aminicenantes bacterium]|nr:MAG: DUF4340 domain-containing protein [Candidatus Aminicenantes bacterium]